MASIPTPPPANAAEALLQLSRLSLRELSMESLLQTVADLVTTVLPDNPKASVTLLVKDRPTTVASTGPLALALDATQYELGHGPCLHAGRTGEVTEIPDSRADTRWPDYTRVAADEGALSSLSIPLVIDEDERVLGALNLYAGKPHGFDEDARAVATAFGPYAAVAAGNVHAYQSARNRADHLEVALQSRAVIEQAKGVLIERFKVTPEHAFRLLALASMNVNRKARDVADHLVRTGDLPGLTQRVIGRRPDGGGPQGRPGDVPPR